MRTNGRVVRLDQGGDTVSEGQAYAMLLSAAIGDSARFARAWGWARAHLQRPDRLLSWHWVGGSVVDPQSATDADVVAAWALAVAANRFHTSSYLDEARAIMRSVVSNETVAYGSGRLLVAGPWARAQPATVDPSYLTPPAFATLGNAGIDVASLESASTRALQALTSGAPHLPPDWAKLSGSSLRASSSPDGSQSPRYGYDAVRVPLWTSVSCRAADRSIAASMWAFLKRATSGSLASVYALDGRTIDRTPSAESLVASAAAARGAGETGSVSSLLTLAQQINTHQPRYYASALIALGRVLLTTDLLKSCA
jgi:endo-1,4-beta-D-glucanase Y